MDSASLESEHQGSNQLSVWKSIRSEDFLKLASTPIPRPLGVGLVITLGIIAYGLILLHQDLQAFRIWIREDGLAEWLTFVVLMMMSVYSFATSSNLNQSGKTRTARKVWFFMGALFLFGAMEEISWGQRILGMSSPEWFLRHNRQGEINIHNLVIFGVNLNRLVFGKFLGFLLLIYLVGVPLLYRVSEKAKVTINKYGIAVAQNYQILLFFIVALVIRLHLPLSKKVDELLELFGCYMVFVMIMHPYNQKNSSWKKMRGFRKARDHEDIC